MSNQFIRLPARLVALVLVLVVAGTGIGASCTSGSGTGGTGTGREERHPAQVARWCEKCHSKVLKGVVGVRA